MPIQVICAARGVSNVHKENHETQQFCKVPVVCVDNADHPLRTPRSSECDKTLSTPTIVSGTVMVMVVNFSEEAIVLPKSTVMGVAEEIYESLIVPISEEDNRADTSFRFLGPRKVKLRETTSFLAIWMANYPIYLGKNEPR